MGSLTPKERQELISTLSAEQRDEYANLVRDTFDITHYGGHEAARKIGQERGDAYLLSIKAKNTKKNNVFSGLLPLKDEMAPKVNPNKKPNTTYNPLRFTGIISFASMYN